MKKLINLNDSTGGNFILTKEEGSPFLYFRVEGWAFASDLEDSRKIAAAILAACDEIEASK